MENKQLFEKQANSYNPFFPLVRLEDIIETISDKSIQWILNNYNHLYVEYSESKAITRNKVPSLLRRKGLWITYNANNELITEYFKGDNKDVTNYTDWTSDENWERFDKLSFADGSITYQHLSEAVKQLLGSGNTITNYPDDEDLTVKGGTLKLKDRDYDVANFSGLGRIILRKNIMVADKKLKNILTQDMINKENTIYEIRYDFDLNGQEVTIPEGCVLDFQGGSLSNGTTMFNSTTLLGKCSIETNLFGDISNTKLLVSWFGSNQDAINRLLALENHIIVIDVPINIESENEDYVFLINNSNIIKGTENGIIKIKELKDTCNLFKIYPKINKQGYGFYDLIIENPNIQGNHVIYIELLESGQVLRKFYINNCMFPESNGYNIYLEHPDTLDGYFTSTIEKCTFKGGIKLNRLGDSVTISSNVFTGRHGVYIDNVPASNLCVFKENNVTCDEGLHFRNCLQLRVINNNIECSNDNIELPNETYVNIIGKSVSLPMQGTIIEGNTFVYGAKSSIDTTINMLYINNLLAPIIRGNLFVERANAKGIIIDDGVSFAAMENNFISGLPWSGSDTILDKGIKTIYNNRILQFSGENYIGNEADILAKKYGQRYIEDYTNTSMFTRLNTNITQDFAIERNIENVIKKSYRTRHLKDGYYENDVSEILYLTDEGFEFPNIKGVQIRNTAGYTSRINYGASLPTSGGKQGDIKFNLLAEEYRHIGWICIKEGTWKPIDIGMRGDIGHRLNPTEEEYGLMYFDTTINKPIWWTGTKWVDATGADV